MRSVQMYLVLIALIPLGCATTGPPATGLLDDYSRLEPHPDVPGGRVYWNPDVDLSKYESIMIDPIEVHFAHDKDFKEPDPERVHAVTSLVKKELEEAISEHFPISKSQGQGVVRLRAQASNTRLLKQLRRTRSYVPTARYRMGSSNAEVELTDSVTGQLIVAWVGPRRSMGEAQRLGRPDDWEAVISTIGVSTRTLVDRIVIRLEEARNRRADKGT